MTERGLSERRALRVIGMSASAYRYRPASDWTAHFEYDAFGRRIRKLNGSYASTEFL